MAPSPQINSLDIILDEVRAERDRQLKHFDALDGKAGIVLGFAGALVVLSPDHAGAVIGVGRGIAVGSGLAALWTFWPRRFWTTDVRPLRDKYLSSDIAFTKLRLLDTQIAMLERMGSVLRTKASRLKVAMAGLALSAVVTALGLGLQSAT